MSEHQKRTPAQAHEACHWRQGQSCARCGRGLPQGEGHLHHRRRRRTLSADEKWCTCALVLLCPDCHGHVHANPAQSRERGLIISDHEQREQRDVPIWVEYPWRAWSVLLCDGTIESAPDLD